MPEPVPLLLDVDGVLSVSAATPGEARQRGLFEHRAVAETAPLTACSSTRESATSCQPSTDVFELAWCTTWKNTNKAISPLIGLATDLRRVPIPGSWTHATPHEG